MGTNASWYVYPALDNDVVLAGHQLVSGTLYPDVNILHIDWGIESQYVMITIGSHCKGMLGFDCLSKEARPVGRRPPSDWNQSPPSVSGSAVAVLIVTTTSCVATPASATPHIGLGREAVSTHC